MAASFLDATLFAFANHVLNQNSWAREHLGNHAGRAIALALGPARLVLGIDAQGSFIPAGADATADATLSIPPLALPLFLKPGADLDPHLRADGDPALCELLRLMGREFRWDVEEDMSIVLGDVLAHQVVGGLHKLASGQAPGLVAGSAVTPGPAEFSAHVEEIRRVRARADALEKRVAALINAA